MGFRYDEWVYPLCYAEPGSWAAEHLPVWIGEGSGLLHMSGRNIDDNAKYITEYACGVITQAENAYFADWSDGDPQGMLKNHGIRALYPAGVTGYARLNPYCLTEQPEKMYYSDPDGSIRSGRLLEEVRTLRIRGDMTDEKALSWVLLRAEEREDFLLQIQEGTAIEAFAREHGTPYEIWDPQQSPFEEPDGPVII